MTFPVDTAIYRPTNWLDPMVLSQIFAESSQPLEVDVGCGKGAFLVWAGQTRPASNFLGIDRQLARLSRVDRKVLRAGLTNVRLIRVEASYCIGKLLPTGSVSAYHIYFPGRNVGITVDGCFNRSLSPICCGRLGRAERSTSPPMMPTTSPTSTE